MQPDVFIHSEEALRQPAAATLVLIHGFMGSGADWQSVTDEIRPHHPDLRLLMPDLPGHGRTPYTSGDGDFHVFIDGLHQRLQQECRGPVFLAGYSLGGRVAMALATAWPDAYQGLLVESASPGISDAGERAARLAADRQLLDAVLRHPAGSLAREEAQRHFLQSWYANPIFTGFSQWSGYSKLLERKAREDARGWQESMALLSTGNMPDLRPGLSRLRIPAVYVCGNLDEKYCSTGRELARDGRFRLHCIEDASHNIHSPLPGLFYRALTLLWQVAG